MANGELLTEEYPIEPYNFDVAPNPYLIGPIKSILQTVEAKILQLYADIAAFQAEISVQTATGAYLDAHGVLYATPRLAGEPDSAYRPRILEALTRGKITLSAIQAAVTNYLNSTTNTNGTTPTAVVYDLRSNPTLCAQDAANGNPIEICDFVVQVNRTISNAFFLGYSYLGYSTYLENGGTSYGGEDPEIELIVNQIKAAGMNAVYKNVDTFSTI